MADTQQDAFDLSDEDFDSIRDALPSDGTVAHTAAVEPEPVIENDVNVEIETETTGVTEGSTDTDDFDFDNMFDQSGAVTAEDTTVVTDDTTVTDTKPATETVTLIHKGVSKTVTIAEAINLAQKGYDYETKTANLAPHRRLVEIVESDPEIRDYINNKVLSKTMPVVSKREDFETEELWLADNMVKAASAANPVIPGKVEATTETTEAPTGQGGEPPLIKMLRQRDPDNFDKVKVYLAPALQSLTVAQYQAVAQDVNAVFKFYDSVKRQKAPQTTIAGQSKEKTFNLRSGQGNSNASRPNKPKNAWDLSNKEFDSVMNKTKGY